MVNRNLIRGIDAGIENWEAEIQTAMGDQSTEELFAPGDELDVNQIVTGNILRVDSEFVLVDVGYKSEGIIPRSEWEDDDEEPIVGDRGDVLLADVAGAAGLNEGFQGMLQLSKRKAKRIKK